MKHSIERAAGAAQASGALGVAAMMREFARAEGVYHGVCRGYREQHRREYLREHQRLQVLRHGFNVAVRTRGFDPLRLEGMKLRIDELDDYLRTLTEVKWEDVAHNVVCTQGKNVMLDAALAGSAYTVVGPYMGLIGAVSFVSSPVAGDTMASHSGWTEGGGANAPTYTGNRPTISWSAASAGSKAPSSAPVFTFTGSGTAKGVFLAFGTGAVATKDNTSGSLWSAGLFSGGDQAVANTNTLTVTYSTSL